MQNQSWMKMDRESTAILHQGNGWRILRWAAKAAVVIAPFVHLLLNAAGHV